MNTRRICFRTVLTMNVLLLVGCSSGGTAPDNTSPVITLTGDNPQVIAVGEVYVELGATASDNRDGDLTSSIVINASAIDSAVPGTYQVTYDVTDAAGNAATTVTRTVTYEDRTPPDLILTGVNPQVIEAVEEYIELGASANDNVDGDLTDTILIDASAVDTMVPGEYVVEYEVGDAAGNVGTATRTVSVQDTTPPVITLLGDDPQIIVAGSPYVELGAVASDTLDGDLSALIVVDATGVDTVDAGAYDVTYDVKDAAGNSAVTASRTVLVENRPPPTAIFTVTNANDAGAGSLRQAILDANANVGLDTVAFDIAGAGVHTIRPLSALPVISDPVIIDGYTQPNSSPNTNSPGLGSNAVLAIELDGTNAGVNVDGLFITSGGSTVRGLVINRFGGPSTEYWAAGVNIEGKGENFIEGNFIGVDATGTRSFGNSGSGVRITSSFNSVGGTSAAARNVISGNRYNGIFITGDNARGNTVQGNLIGTDASGTLSLGNSFEGIRTVAQDNVIGGTTVGAGNVISGNKNGVGLLGNQSRLNTMQGNFIGTDVFGTSALGNIRTGIYISGTFNIIGGTELGTGNVISGNGLDGIVLAGVYLTGDPVPGQASDNLVQGNFIGSDSSGTLALGNGGNGVLITGATGSEIGGFEGEIGNIIAFNGLAGVKIDTCCEVRANSNAIRSNSIYSNLGLGIDLGSEGANVNDLGDGDTGPNALQNFPELTLATAGNTTIEGRLNSSANSRFRLEFFANDACDPTGYGEGETFLGSTSVTTDGSGNVAFKITFENTVAAGQFVTATAIDRQNNTSEFSECLETVAASGTTILPAEAATQMLESALW